MHKIVTREKLLFFCILLLTLGSLVGCTSKEEKALDNAKKSQAAAEESLKDAEDNYNETLDMIDDYNRQKEALDNAN